MPSGSASDRYGSNKAIGHPDERERVSEKNITRVERDEGEPGITDWQRLDAMSDEEIERQAAHDPEWTAADDRSADPVIVAHPDGRREVVMRFDDVALIAQFGCDRRRIERALRAYLREHPEPA